MKKENAKFVTSTLLWAESIGMMVALIAGLFTLMELFHFPLDNEESWFVDNIYYVLAGLIVVYGFFIRPLRRKAVEIFSSVIHFGRWTYYAELLSILVFVVCGYVDCALLSLTALALYSGWKIIEIFADRLMLRQHM